MGKVFYYSFVEFILEFKRLSVGVRLCTRIGWPTYSEIEAKKPIASTLVHLFCTLTRL